MHNVHANFAKIPLARKHYDQEFVNEMGSVTRCGWRRYRNLGFCPAGKKPIAGTTKKSQTAHYKLFGFLSQSRRRMRKSTM